MQPLRYAINITLDGCCDHRAVPVSEDMFHHAVATFDRADTLIFGRKMYQLMEDAWRPTPTDGARAAWMEPFAAKISALKKYVVSNTLEHVDWNAELVRGDLGTFVRQLKEAPGRGLYVAGLQLPLALAKLGLIDEYEFIVHPVIAGHGPTLFAGLSESIDLTLVHRIDFASGAVALRYEPKQ